MLKMLKSIRKNGLFRWNFAVEKLNLRKIRAVSILYTEFSTFCKVTNYYRFF